MAFGFKNNKEKASIRTVTIQGRRSSLSAGEVTVSFPIDSDEIVLAIMCQTPLDYRWHYISDRDEGSSIDSAKILRAYHSTTEDTFYVSAYVEGTIPSENPSVTIKAVLMQID